MSVVAGSFRGYEGRSWQLVKPLPLRETSNRIFTPRCHRFEFTKFKVSTVASVERRLKSVVHRYARERRRAKLGDHLKNE